MLSRRSPRCTAERKGNIFERFEGFSMKAKARIWPGLAYVFQVLWEAHRRARWPAGRRNLVAFRVDLISNLL